MVGRTLGHYEILGKLGSGGMGDVYLAEDTKLDRKVALKVLPPDFAENDSRRARFEREAKAVAALNHPNIVTIHSVEDDEGTHFITMEHVRGRNLGDLLPSQGFRLNRFFEIAIPLADAVAAAHRAGITHRDLKPDNVMVSEDGTVKVLDFGLAKLGHELVQMGSELPTASATEEGRIVGTIHYMSPEQAAGKAVDSRSDIFSLGIVFYEMLTGRRPFGGDTPTAVLSSILKDDPKPVGELEASIPRDLQRLVHRCLNKNPIGRYQSAIDLRYDLEETQRDVDSGEAFPAPSMSRPSRFAGWTGVAAGLLALAAVVWLTRGREERSSAAVPRLQNPRQVTSALEVENYPTWSPDGVRLAYEATRNEALRGYNVWVAQIGSGEPVKLTRDQTGNNRLPSWSPDGRQIAFLSESEGSWRVNILPAIGGTARSVLSLPGVPNNVSAARWSRDGAELFVSMRESGENVVIVLSLHSLETRRIALPYHEGNVCWDLSVSPDGRRFAYAEGGGGNTEVTRLWTVLATGEEAVPLTDGLTNVRSPTWSGDGRKIFYVSNRGGSMDLWQQVITEDGQPVGEPLPVTQGLGIRSAVFSPDGHWLAYSKGRPVRNAFRAPILSDRPATWDDVDELTSEQAYIEYLDVSPNGQFLAVSSDRSGNQDLWVLPAEGGEMTRLTTDPAPDWHPRWSPDGNEILFYSYRTGNRDLWVMPSRGGPARQITSHPAQDLLPSWAPDGHEIAFQSRREGQPGIWLVDARGEREPEHLVDGSNEAEWSPSGDWLVTRRDFRLFRVPREGGNPELLFDRDAYTPRFSPDGQWIYYSVITGPLEDHDLWRLSVETGEVSRLTKLAGRRGFLGYSFATDGRYLYFTWSEDFGDIWVMDVVEPDG